jgi:hypothetical protein
VTDKRQSLSHKRKINRLRGMRKASAEAVERVLAEAEVREATADMYPIQVERFVDRVRYPPREIKMNRKT